MRLIALLAIVLSADPAAACDCAETDLADTVKHASLIVVGTVTAVQETRTCPPNKPASACNSTFTHEVAVDGSWKGAPGKTVSLRTGRSTCSIATNLGKGKRWVLFLGNDGPSYQLHMCSPPLPATPQTVAAITKQLGAPKPPT
jgi:hypothetical protein